MDFRRVRPARASFGRSCIRRFRRREDGGTAVEFAVVSGLFILILFLLIEFGLMFWARNTITAASRDGARYAIVRGSDSGRQADTAGVSAFIRGRTSLSPLAVTTTWDDNKKPGTNVNVNVRYTHRLISPFLGFIVSDSVVLASTSRMVIVF